MRVFILSLLTMFFMIPVSVRAESSPDSMLEVRYTTSGGEEKLYILELSYEPTMRFNHGWIELTSAWMNYEPIKIPVGAKCSISITDPFSAVETVTDDTMPVFFRSGDAFCVRLKASCRCEVYDLQGHLLASYVFTEGEHEIISAALKGLFIVKAGNQSIKVIK